MVERANAEAPEAARKPVDTTVQSDTSKQDLFKDLRNGGTGVKPEQTAKDTQALVASGQAPKLEITTPDAAALAETAKQITAKQNELGQHEQFNGMIKTDGQTVFGAPKRGSHDFYPDVDGKDDPGWLWNGKDGVITKSGIDKFTAEADAAAHGRFRDPTKEAYVASLKNLSQNWDKPDMAPYKDANGNMSKESFAKGMSTLPDRENEVKAGKSAVDQQAEQLRKDTEALAEKEKSKQPAKPGEDPTKIDPSKAAAKPELNDDAAQRSEVKKGEGPYQVAARILGADGQKHDHKEVMALTRAMQAQYREENKADQNMASLKVKHHLLSAENAGKVVERITDPKLKERLTAQLFKTAS